VITAQQIEKLGATTVADVLRTVPGLHVSTARGVNDVFVIRGFYDEFNSYVLLLLNGIPITNAVNGGRPQAWRMPVHNLARIEIMRGPGSALYGADAAAGVVNIVTKTAREIGGVYVGAYGGSFETGGAWLQSGGRWGDLEAAFSVEASTGCWERAPRWRPARSTPGATISMRASTSRASAGGFGPATKDS
jgi:iron complex outermembrane receptor protein